MDDPAEVWRQLAAALKAARATAGVPGLDFAARATDMTGESWSQSKVSRIENKITKPSVADVEAWSEITRVSPADRAALTEMAEQVSTITRSLRASQQGGLAAGQRAFGEREARCTAIANVESKVIPGLLQVPAYAEQLLRRRTSPGEDVAAGVIARMDRQAILFDPAKTFTFVVTEVVLAWRHTEFDVRAAQAQRLLDMEARPNVTLAVLPYRHPWPIYNGDSWIILDAPGAPEVVREWAGGDQTWDAESDVADYRARTDAALNAAVTGEQARDLIRAAAL